MPRTVLITGGTGFIGHHLVTKLAAEAHHVRVLSRSKPENWQANRQIAYCVGDFLCSDQIKAALAEVDTVYHLAVTTTPGWSNDFILYDAQTNLMGTLNLIQAAAEAGVQRFIFVSSGGSVYGNSPNKPIPEDYPANPISAHGVSKLAIEKYLEIFRRTLGMEYRVLRAANPYGAGQDFNKGQGFIAYALSRIACDKEILIWGDGTVKRDFFYIDDLTAALQLVLDDAGHHRVYNVGSGQAHSLNEMIGLMEEVTQCKARVSYDLARPADVPYNCLDVTRLQHGLNWQPRVGLPTGLQRSWRWIQSVVDQMELVKV